MTLPANLPTSLAPNTLLGSECGHAVQFYERDDFLIGSVADFLADGFLAGQAMIAIATADHRAAIDRSLRSRGLPVAEATLSGRLVMLDARETLARFMAGTVPDEAQFHTVIGAVIDRSRQAGTGNIVRAFGEMVDVLWKDGNPGGAIALERLWNELACINKFSLLCGYSIGNFSDEAHADQFRQLCGEHTHVLPTESYTQATESQRLVATSMLQQRARALETEIARRGRLEKQLLDALADRDRLLEEERQARRDAEQARHDAQQANRAKTAFLAVMSHELRTPLNAIGGYVDLLTLGVYGPLVEAQYDALARVRGSGTHLLGLIDQVLEYAHVESGTMRFAAAPVPLASLIAETNAIIQPLMSAAGITYSHTAPGSIIALADAHQVRQILLNLLTNATKFTPKGGHVVLVCEANDGVVYIRVADSGVGIPSDKLEAIFQPFVQADSALTRVKGGVGLGLAISRDLARAMHGELSVSSVEGTGSVFTLTLPRADAAA